MHRFILYLILLLVLISNCSGDPANVVPTAAPLAIVPPPPTPLITAGPVDMPPVELLPTPTAAGPLMSTGSNSSDQVPTVELPPPPPATATRQPAGDTGRGEALTTGGQYTVGAAQGVPETLVEVAQATALNDPELFQWVEVDPANPTADILLTINDGQRIAGWVYAVAAPFATVADETSWPAVTAGWSSGSSELGRLMLDPETAAALSATWGPSTAPQIVSDDFIGQVWAARPSWIIVPFERLRPEFKVLAIDGRSPLDIEFELGAYPLVLPITVTGRPEAVAAFLAKWTGPATNYDPGKLTRVAMTGVTALVRATAAQMEQRGILWPGEEVAPILQSADIAHISNEVSFAADCPFPDPYGGTSFCSRDPYFELLQHLGTDVIELTGNHLNDYGREPLNRSLDMYTQGGMQWFGGGRDLADASRPAIFEHNGNRIAFVGCNPVGPAGDWALVNAAGSRPCGPDLAAQINELRAEGYVVIATLQYVEHYVYDAPPDQQQAFSELAAAGAAAVSGSQGHHAQGFAFENGTYIHYGLGNLFFDQMDMMGTRQTFVDTYTIYDGRLISISLWTGLIENWARPRLMTAEERAGLLETVFDASGW